MYRWSDGGDPEVLAALDAAHARFLDDQVAARAVRDRVLASWRRSRSLGVEPEDPGWLYNEDLDTKGVLMAAAEPVLADLEARLAGQRVAMVLCDGQGMVVQRRVPDSVVGRLFREALLIPGFGFPERTSGTNGIGTALAERRPVYITGAEHFAHAFASFTCAAAPVREPLSGRIEGVLDITSLRTEAGPRMLDHVKAAAAAIERRMLERSARRERELLVEFARASRRAPGQARGTGPPWNMLSGRDRASLLETAAELIAGGRPTVTEVPISTGGTVILLCRHVANAVGGALSPRGAESEDTGFVVQASVPDKDHGGPATVAGGRGGWHGGPAAAPSARAAAARTFPVHRMSDALRGPDPSLRHDVAGVGRGSGGADDGWLVAVGEPTIGRLAVLARRRLALLCDTGLRVGTTLDVRQTAEELVKVTVPEFADVCTVDLAEGVLDGETPGLGEPPVLRRAASSEARIDGSLWYAVGDIVVHTDATPQARCLAGGQAVHEPMLSEAHGWLAQDPERGAALVAQGTRSLVAAPLRARDAVLGVVTFVRTEKTAAFEDDDVTVAEELACRAALCIDNARQYTHEHATALALQRSLLPQGLPHQNAVDAAYRYLPARSSVGGDWYDVIPLSGCRVALVVGDVAGHGVHAAATMGRLRTAVHNFAALDLPVEDLLTGLDDLVCRLDDEETHGRVIGASCLYAVYDPVTRRCTMARAGHPEPALVGPDGSVGFVRLPPSPPLGVGGIPFETAEIELAADSRLVFFTDGLIERRDRDIDEGLDTLRDILLESGPVASPEKICDAVLGALLPERLDDDVAVLVAAPRALDDLQVAVWDVPPDPSQVSAIRDAVTVRLSDWNLEELAFATELVVSELVTNAIRYGCEPVQVRLLRDQGLVCEVSDGSSTSPRMRRARNTDEGGRGLFLVAQLCHRWGTRYTDNGKVIWSEQRIPAG